MDIVQSLRTALILFITLFTTTSFAKGLPDGFTLDHGFTFFTIESVSDSIDGKRVDLGWKLSGQIRIYGDAPDRSSIKLVLKKDGNVLAERRTRSYVYKTGDPVLKKAVNSTAAGSQQPHIISGSNHQGALPKVEPGTGEYEVDVIYVDGDTNEEYLAHTYTLDVQKIDTLDAVAGELLVRPPKYLVSRHQETLTTILSSWMDYSRDHAPGMMVLLWNASPLETSSGAHSVNSTFLRCSVDGKPIKLGNPNHSQANQIKGLDATRTSSQWNSTNSGSKRFIYERHNDRNSLEYRSGSDYREELIFYNYHTVLPIVDNTDGYPPENWSENDKISPYTSFSDHPGQWECQWLDNGELLRTFRWKVDNDGKLVPHPEQKKGLTLNPGAILVETLIPEGGAKFDGRLVPDAVKEGGFYGWKWKSSEMKKLAKQVPEIGKPWPVPSAPEFVPEPDKGPSPQEIAKAEREAKSKADAEKRKAEQEARDAKLKAEREEYDAKMQAQAEANEKTRQDTFAKELAKTEAMVAEQLKQANEDAANALAKAKKERVTHSPMHLISRILLAVALVLSGLLLAKDKIPQASAITDVLLPMASTVGLATIGISIFDLVLDLVTLRPIIGDGLIQVAGLASGALLAQDTISNMLSNEKVTGFINTLKENQVNLGFAGIALGIVHLLMGGSYFI